VHRLITIAIIVLAFGHAVAAPRSTRVVLVDPDPELLRAMTTALQPWKLEVIADASPIDEIGATERADALRARFVVWRSGTDLVVFDRERGDVQHRDVAAGALDPVDAASAALSVKTLMRLPPPEEMDRPPPPVATSGLELRLQAGTAVRIASGQASGRLAGTAMVKPIAALRVGVMGDAGTGDDFKIASFSGTWSDWSVLAIASWTFTRGKLEIEPWLAGGLTRSHVRAATMGAMAESIDERDTLAAVRGGATVRYRLAHLWTVGASVGVEGLAGTPTYTRPKPDDKELYEVPALGFAAGIVVAVDLGR
jgi:hypothetical protein